MITAPRSGSAGYVRNVLAETPAPSARVIAATHYGLITHTDSAAAAFLCCPVLVIGACEKDYWPTVQTWEQFVPHAEVVPVHSTGHYIMLEQPGQFNALTEGFLMRVRRGDAGRVDRRGLPSGCGDAE